MLGPILSAFLQIVALALLLATPLFFVAWRRGSTQTVRSFLVASGVIGILSGLLEGLSERQVAQCIEAGNPDCIDPGTRGLQLLFVALYSIVAWIRAYQLWRG